MHTGRITQHGKQRVKRFQIFCHILDAEMKDVTHAGVALKTKREEKEAVSDEDEQLFRRNGLLRQSRAIWRPRTAIAKNPLS